MAERTPGEKIVEMKLRAESLMKAGAGVGSLGWHCAPAAGSERLGPMKIALIVSRSSRQMTSSRSAP